MSMTAGQRWRKDKPTEPGWYWFRHTGDNVKSFQIMQVYWDMSVHGITTEADHVDECDGEWQGPITPHDQEAG